MKNPSGLAFASSRAAHAAAKHGRKAPVQERSTHTVEAILTGAVQVLVHDGYDAFTTTRVAARAGVSVGTLYQYFPDKHALVAAIRSRYVDGLMAVVRAAFAAHPDTPPAGLAGPVVRAMLAYKRDHRVVSQGIHACPSQPRSLDTDEDGTVVTLLATRLAGSCARPELAARVFVAALKGALMVAVFGDPALLDDPRFERQLVALAEGALAGLAADA